MTKAATPLFTRQLEVSPTSDYTHRQSDCEPPIYVDTIMHGESKAGSVHASQWLHRDHAANIAIPLLAVDASLSHNINKRN